MDCLYDRLRIVSRKHRQNEPAQYAVALRGSNGGLLPLRITASGKRICWGNKHRAEKIRKHWADRIASGLVSSSKVWDSLHFEQESAYQKEKRQGRNGMTKTEVKYDGIHANPLTVWELVK